MARPASGQDVLEQAKEAIVSARTVEQLRQAQAVVLPLEFGLTLPQTAQAIGVSVGWACRLRRSLPRVRRHRSSGAAADAEKISRDNRKQRFSPRFSNRRARAACWS